MEISSATLNATRGRLLNRFGPRVEQWWEQLPTVISALTDRWELVVGDPVARGNTSLVIRCRRPDGSRGVLKLTPDAQIVVGEASALRSWEASGRVPVVWDSDEVLGALLLEAIPNELPVSESGLVVGLDEVANLIGSLHRSGAPVLGNGIVSQAERIGFIFEHWIGRHGGRGDVVTCSVPVQRLRRGYQLAQELVSDAVVPVLLHGDLHPGNVLDGGSARGLVAIDPRPCVGDAPVDAVDWVFWAVDDPRVWEQRSRNLAVALGIDHERLWAWCAAFAAMLAASKAAQGAPAEVVTALLALGP